MNPRILAKTQAMAEERQFLLARIEAAQTLEELEVLETDLLYADKHYQEMQALLWLPDRGHGNWVH